MVNPNKAGLVSGVLIGGWHLVWSLLVLSAWHSRLINVIAASAANAGHLK
jgi:hypothetical protein